MSALQFLNKKSWHTATLRNNEKVWAAEKKAVQEKKRLAELQKNLAEEREHEELRRLEAESGRLTGDALKRTQRLDWMYEGTGPAGAGARCMTAQDPALNQGPGASKVNEKDREDYLTGRKEPRIQNADACVGAGQLLPPPPKFADTEAKLRDDPLMAIKLAERAAVDAIRANPVQMAAIRKNASEKERRKAERKLRRDDRQLRREARDRKLRTHADQAYETELHRGCRMGGKGEGERQARARDADEAPFGLDARRQPGAQEKRPTMYGKEGQHRREGHGRRAQWSDRERARKLEEMRDRAEEHDRQRVGRVEQYKSSAEKEQQKPDLQRSDHFVMSISKGALEENLRRKRNSAQRNAA